jgi:putative CocE/NonD family hydrolase
MSMMTHNRPDGFWKRSDASTEFGRMDFPAQHVVGYYDFMCRDSVKSFQAMRRRSASPRSRQNQQLILGPWDHATGNPKAAEADFGPWAKMDVLGENLKWFGRFLNKSASDSFPAVRYSSMGDNTWHDAESWPPPEARPMALFFRSGGRANTRKGDGRLDRHEPLPSGPPDTFRADPPDPVPCRPALGKQYRDVWGPVEQRLAQDRPDVLVNATPPLKNLPDFAGLLAAELWVSADTPDADWVVKVIDVERGGYCRPLAMGIRRGSARDSELDRRPPETGKKNLLKIDLGHAAARIDRGHRLCVQVAGSNFPICDRNTTTGEGPTGVRTRVATEHVWHTAGHPPPVILPVVNQGDYLRSEPRR